MNSRVFFTIVLAIALLGNMCLAMPGGGGGGGGFMGMGGGKGNKHGGGSRITEMLP
ncbi:hypothetical protein X975_21635, partial [Stegodyphus mimosarum]